MHMSVKQNGGFSGHTMSLKLLWSLKLRGIVTEYISTLKTSVTALWMFKCSVECSSPRPGSPPRMESACGVWWWPWCRWSPGRWWCHFCSCPFVRKLDGRVLTAAPAATGEQHHVTGEQRNTRPGGQMKVWKCHCGTDVQGRCDRVRHRLL